MAEETLSAYAEAHTTPETEVLDRLNRETHLTKVYPRMLAGLLQGTFLRFISTMIRPMRILEIGTFTGYSAINLAAGLAEGGLIHTIEADPEQEDIIRRYLLEAGMTDRVRLHIGKAIEVIPTLEENWDLVYLDADKPNYPLYYQMIMRNLKPGGFLLADNVLWNGKVLEPKEKMNRDTRGIDDFNKAVQADEQVENVLLPFRDGIMMVRKKAGQTL